MSLIPLPPKARTPADSKPSAAGRLKQSAAFTWTVTVLNAAKAITYYDGETALDLAPATYNPGVATTLPTPEKTGYEFGGWYTDAEFTGEPVSEVATTETEDQTFYAKWTASAYTITYLDGTTPLNLAPASHTTEDTVTLPEDVTKEGKTFGGWYDNAGLTGDAVEVGSPYTDELIANLTAAVQATAARHGLVVTGWQNADGSAVTGATIVGMDDQLTAVWEEVNPLVPRTRGEGAIANAKPVTYSAYALDDQGNAFGTVKVTVGKTNPKTGRAAVKAVVTPYVGKAATFKATEAKGKATIATDAATTVPLAAKKNGEMTLVIGTEGVEGVFTASTGAFKGSCKDSVTEKKLKFKGVFTDGVGYGFAKATDGVRNVTLTAK